MAKSDESTAKPAEKKKSKKLLIIIVAAVLVLGGGGAAYFMFFKGESTPPPPEPGKVIALEAITLNLKDGHFLKLSLALQATADATGELDGSRALDLAVSEFSNRSIAELSTSEAREAGKAELLKKIEEAYEGQVMDLYFTQFVMQ
ncbi:hypothetical protein GCM10022243_41160 [Saccharothrix violaceirubra]|uniref:Flagellar protein FliL n=1 Tax=Saccharothrix violaceirubra TaxID=413306 RepID=A0A7W7WYM4_9PSEU|nr:flagellar basal body-associated FliL family protein [Saccharothrix violaceirubra]MBB4968372.1 flagellar FliL protein [Saccharothrix violaceirubra]